MCGGRWKLVCVLEVWLRGSTPIISQRVGNVFVLARCRAHRKLGSFFAWARFGAGRQSRSLSVGEAPQGALLRARAESAGESLWESRRGASSTAWYPKARRIGRSLWLASLRRWSSSRVTTIGFEPCRVLYGLVVGARRCVSTGREVQRGDRGLGCWRRRTCGACCFRAVGVRPHERAGPACASCLRLLPGVDQHRVSSCLCVRGRDRPHVGRDRPYSDLNRPNVGGCFGPIWPELCSPILCDFDGASYEFGELGNMSTDLAKHPVFSASHGGGLSVSTERLVSSSWPTRAYLAVCICIRLGQAGAAHARTDRARMAHFVGRAPGASASLGPQWGVPGAGSPRGSLWEVAPEGAAHDRPQFRSSGKQALGAGFGGEFVPPEPNLARGIFGMVRRGPSAPFLELLRVPTEPGETLNNGCRANVRAGRAECPAQTWSEPDWPRFGQGNIVGASQGWSGKHRRTAELINQAPHFGRPHRNMGQPPPIAWSMSGALYNLFRASSGCFFWGASLAHPSGTVCKARAAPVDRHRSPSAHLKIPRR